MFYAKISKAFLIKKLIESIKDLVSNVNLYISDSGISFQALDKSSICLVTLNLFAEGFDEYRCDKELTLGISIKNLNKLLSCGENEDCLTLSCDEDPSKIKIKFENNSKLIYIYIIILNIESKKRVNFELNLISICSKYLDVDDTNYNAFISKPSHEFNKICRELHFNYINSPFKLIL